MPVKSGATRERIVKKMFEGCGFSDVKVIKDLAGLDRVVRGKLPD